MFQGILGAEICENKEKKAIFQDFNLGVCISRMNSLTKGYDLQEMYLKMPTRLETIRYRRSITGDLMNESLRNAFAWYSKVIERAEKYEKNSTYSNELYQKQKWHLDALLLYEEAVTGLFEKLSQTGGLSEAMQELIVYLKESIDSDDFQRVKNLGEKLYKRMEMQPVCFSIQKNKVVVEAEDESESFDQRMVRAFQIPQKKEEERFVDDNRELSLMEKNLAKRIIKLQGWGDDLQKLLDTPMDLTLLQLSKDIKYYLGFFSLVEEMKEKGYDFCMPEEGEQLEIQAGYDAAMAIKSDAPVISNDFSMRKDESFFVITGANGGGKTTFARMVGQILYFCRMGLLVPCTRAVIPHFQQLLSHFSNEESEMSGRGKLVEELERLQPMMKEESRGSFVILNELFTTAATLDAGIMGQKVLDYFMDINCSGIYVTHIQSLAKERDGVVSMVAELEEDHHTRSFKIARKPAEEGEYEDSLITKYNMTYERMKAVIGHGD